MSDEASALEGFRGVARLFPLPNLVMFPHVVQPLHIFEPRYRQMMADALEGDRLLAIVLLEPGWEEDYEGRPPIHAVACLGRVFNEECLADGRYNLLLHGLRRVRIIEELPADRLYRQAKVEVMEDVCSCAPAEEKQLRDEMERVLPAFLASQGGAAEQAQKLFDSELTLGMLCDIFTFALPLEAEFKQQLLEEPDAARRAANLLEHLGQLSPPEPAVPRPFPPPFSEN